VPAWKSYWRVRDRLLATVLSVYILAAFLLAGAGVGAAASLRAGWDTRLA
jgi:hypothetical protein